MDMDPNTPSTSRSHLPAENDANTLMQKIVVTPPRISGPPRVDSCSASARKRKRGSQPRKKKESKEPTYEVERILDKRIVDGFKQYKILWKDYPESDATWEPYNQTSCDELIELYEASDRLRRAQRRSWMQGDQPAAPAVRAGPSEDCLNSSTVVIKPASSPMKVDQHPDVATVSDNLNDFEVGRAEVFDESSVGDVWRALTVVLPGVVMGAGVNEDQTSFLSVGQWKSYEKMTTGAESMEFPGEYEYRYNMPERVLRYLVNSYGDPFVEMEWKDGFVCPVSFPAATKHFALIFLPWLSDYVEKTFGDKVGDIVKEFRPASLRPLLKDPPSSAVAAEASPPATAAASQDSGVLKMDVDSAEQPSELLAPTVQEVMVSAAETSSKRESGSGVKQDDIFSHHPAENIQTSSEILPTDNAEPPSDSSTTPALVTKKLDALLIKENVQEPIAEVESESDKSKKLEFHPSFLQTPEWFDPDDIEFDVENASTASATALLEVALDHGGILKKKAKRGSGFCKAVSVDAGHPVKTHSSPAKTAVKPPVAAAPQPGNPVYDKKSAVVRKFVPLLQFIVTKLEGDPGRHQQLHRTRLLLKVAREKDPAPTYQNLLKCEEIILHSRQWLSREGGAWAASLFETPPLPEDAAAGMPPPLPVVPVPSIAPSVPNPAGFRQIQLDPVQLLQSYPQLAPFAPLLKMSTAVTGGSLRVTDPKSTASVDPSAQQTPFAQDQTRGPGGQMSSPPFLRKSSYTGFPAPVSTVSSTASNNHSPTFSSAHTSSAAALVQRLYPGGLQQGYPNGILPARPSVSGSQHGPGLLKEQNAPFQSSMTSHPQRPPGPSRSNARPCLDFPGRAFLPPSISPFVQEKSGASVGPVPEPSRLLRVEYVRKQQKPPPASTVVSQPQAGPNVRSHGPGAGVDRQPAAPLPGGNAEDELHSPGRNDQRGVFANDPATTSSASAQNCDSVRSAPKSSQAHAYPQTPAAQLDENVPRQLMRKGVTRPAPLVGSVASSGANRAQLPNPALNSQANSSFRPNVSPQRPFVPGNPQSTAQVPGKPVAQRALPSNSSSSSVRNAAQAPNPALNSQRGGASGYSSPHVSPRRFAAPVNIPPTWNGSQAPRNPFAGPGCAADMVSPSRSNQASLPRFAVATNASGESSSLQQAHVEASASSFLVRGIRIQKATAALPVLVDVVPSNSVAEVRSRLTASSGVSEVSRPAASGGHVGSAASSTSLTTPHQVTPIPPLRIPLRPSSPAQTAHRAPLNTNAVRPALTARSPAPVQYRVVQPAGTYPPPVSRPVVPASQQNVRPAPQAVSPARTMPSNAGNGPKASIYRTSSPNIPSLTHPVKSPTLTVSGCTATNAGDPVRPSNSRAPLETLAARNAPGVASPQGKVNSAAASAASMASTSAVGSGNGHRSFAVKSAGSTPENLSSQLNSVAKPLNRYHQEVFPVLSERFPSMSHQDLSKLIQDQWSRLKEEQRRPYKEEYEREREQVLVSPKKTAANPPAKR